MYKINQKMKYIIKENKHYRIIIKDKYYYVVVKKNNNDGKKNIS